MPCFSASDTISIFDASLLWFDKDPHEQLHGYGLYGWIVLLIRDREVCDLAYTLLTEIEQGSIRAEEKSWLVDISESWRSRLGSVPAGLDPRNTTTKVAELVKFAIKHGLSPNFLAHLIPEQTTPKADLRTPSIDRTTSNARAHRPTRERAQRAIEAVYGSNIPDQTSEPNAILCRKIGDWLKANKLPEVSDDTILRAAGRRK